MRSFIDFRRTMNEQEALEVIPGELDTSNDLEIDPVSRKKQVSQSLDPDSLFRSLLEFHAQLRAFHWQTFSFSEHNGAGTVYETVDDVLDKLVESYQGYMGKERIKFGGQLNLLNYEEVDSQQWLSSIIGVIDQLRKDTESRFKGPSDLLNIMDELLGAVSKFKYLLTLK